MEFISKMKKFIIEVDEEKPCPYISLDLRTFLDICNRFSDKKCFCDGNLDARPKFCPLKEAIYIYTDERKTDDNIQT